MPDPFAPPPGHHFTYHFHFEPEGPGGPSLPDFDFTLPSARATEHIATMRVSRRGGETAADSQFRARLYAHVGAVAVAAGHVETAMKRLLLLLKHSAGGFSDVDLNWTDLEKALRDEAQADPTEARRKRLARVLDWADRNRVKWRRDNVIHAYWWNFDLGGSVLRSRFRRRQDGEQIIGTWAKLEEDAQLLFQYANRLDELLGEDWGRVLLPSNYPRD